MSPVWRYRSCPRCDATFPAGKLVTLNYGPAWGRKGEFFRECPHCGYVAQTHRFSVVDPRQDRLDLQLEPREAS